jgi:hypothetical protein
MSKKPLISVPAQVINMNPRADRSWRLQFETRELAGDEVKILADNFQGEGWLVFKPNDAIVQAEIPQGDADSGTKSQSARLRDVIFILWKQAGEKGDFETFYRTYLERLIEYVKSKLQPEEV